MKRFLLRPRLVKGHIIPAVLWTSLIFILFIANSVHGDIEAGRLDYSILEAPKQIFKHIFFYRHNLTMFASFFFLWAAGSLIGIYSVNKIDDELTSKMKVIDDLRALQERYNDVASTVREWIWEVDFEGRFVFASEQVRDILGYSPDEIIGKYYYDFFTEEAMSDILEVVKLKAEKRESFHSFVNANYTKDGREVILETNAIPLLDKETNTLLGYVGSDKDITDQLKARKILEASLKEKEVLLREVHHRVKNNMAVISSLLSLQSSYIDDKKYLDMFNESIDRIKSMALVHDKLYQSDDITRIDVQDYVKSLAGNVRSSFYNSDKEVKLNINVDEMDLDIDNLVPCGLIINELLTNSFKHAFNGHENPEITVTMTKLDDGNISLSISDNGIGLPEGFDISNPTGLGHKLLDPLIKQMEGTMEVNVGNGTEFRFIFPEKHEIAKAD